MHELELRGVEKGYRGKIAVKDLSAVFTTGVFGLLGENGAGKTTLMRMICGILKITKGDILLDGMHTDKMGGEYRRLLGYLPQDFGYYADYTAKRFLDYIAALKAVPREYADIRVSEMLELVNLTEVKNKKLKTFSGGMIKRVGIAQALLNDPQILILDEPTSGLDPKERVRFRNIISSLSKNKLVLLSTHIVSDIEYIADQILLMQQGKLIRMGTEAEIIKSVQGHVWECVVHEDEGQRLNERYAISNLKNQDGMVKLRIISPEPPVEHALSVIPTLEDTYLYYLGKGGTICG